MCGIFGYTGGKRNLGFLIEGLKHLEYRGYDSCGVGFCSHEKIEVIKTEGRIEKLEQLIASYFNIPITAGIAHTRWATHGENTTRNAHPHMDCEGLFAVVHNGIIENYEELRKFLEKRGHRFVSETDTEVIPHLLEEKYKRGEKDIFLSLKKDLEGSFALLIMTPLYPGTLFILRKKSPLVVGKGEGEGFVASDIHALLPYTEDLLPLEEGIVGEIKGDSFKWREKKKRKSVFFSFQFHHHKAKPLEKYPHFMLREIYEQPEAQERILNFYLQGDILKERLSSLSRPSRVILTGCGTSYHAGLIGRIYMERFAGIPTQVEYASEFRYLDPVLKEDDLIILLSQSGETADTLGVLELIKEKNIPHLGIVNVPFSTLERESMASLPLLSGPEKGVVATKTFTSQITILYLLSQYWSKEGRKTMGEKLEKIPSLMEKVLENAHKIEEIAERYFHYSHALYLGRGYQYPIALEGALKLKEVSYLHAEGYPAAEMKHGPLALVDENMPVVVIAPKDRLFAKIKANVEEVKSRKGRVIIVTDEEDGISDLGEDVILIPPCEEELMPLLSVIPLQLLAYYIAVKRGCDVDKPRNLAKSVTVE